MSPCRESRPRINVSASELTALFNAAYHGYATPVMLDEPAFGRHLRRNDVDLTVSQVAITDSPAAFALIARRGSAAWVAGMGTVPAARRSGLGERTLTAALRAAELTGTKVAWLEVLEQNHAALAPAAAVSALRAVAGEAAGRPVRLVNVAADGMIALAAGRLGSAVDHVQREMRLSLAARPGDE